MNKIYYVQNFFQIAKKVSLPLLAKFFRNATQKPALTMFETGTRDNKKYILGGVSWTSQDFLKQGYG